ncbi:hypothetical protein F383_20085 [Gossypium arboreum]|uniref:Uncharacterized protein n=1 Tax=Gossypium arboreum TaxID=29729 RepID=A0A0B0NHJ3_GOSAR|nr:hypothetical protein F383_20085 [Gossypium arboreum]
MPRALSRYWIRVRGVIFIGIRTTV